MKVKVDPLTGLPILVNDTTTVVGRGGGVSTPDASSTVKGKTKLSVAPVSDPIAVGDNDPRVPVGIVNSKKMVGCGLATTANITLSGHQTIDGTLTSGSTTVLVKDQTNKAQNGMYTASSGAWTRTTSPIDMSTATELFGRAIQIGAGTVNADKVFIITNETPPNVGVDDIEFAEINDDPLIEDTTPANKFVLSIASLMFGDLELYGDILFGGNPTFSGYLSVSSAGIGTLDTDGIIAQEQSVDTSNNPALAFYNADQTEYMHLDVTNHRLSTPVDVPLEVKMGGTTASNYTYFYINGGLRYRVQTKTANYTITIGDYIVAYTTLAAARTATLPDISTVAEGQEFIVVDATTAGSAATNNIILQRGSTDLFIDGTTSKTIAIANGGLKVKKLNSRWAFEFLTPDPVNLSGTQTITGAKTFSNRILLPGNSAATPAVAFTVDTDTGIYRPNADEIGITTGGTLRLKVTNTETNIVGDLNHDGTNVGFFGVAPVARATELTDELTTVTHTAPGTPDYAISAPVDSSGGAAFGFASADEFNTLMSVVANLQTRNKELEDKLTAYGLLTDAD